MQWLALSLVLSVVLTVVLNVALRMFPGAGERAGRALTELATSRRDDPDDGRVRVFVPWKAMLVASIVLTLLVNVLLRVR